MKFSITDFFSKCDQIRICAVDIDSEREMEAVRSLLDSRSLKNPSTECVKEGLKTCFLNISSIHLP